TGLRHVQLRLARAARHAVARRRVEADSLVYNLEFLQLQYLYADLVRDLRPRPDAVMLMGNAIWNFPPDIDRQSYALTANRALALPLFVAVGDLGRDALRSHVGEDGLFHYVAFANADNAQLPNLLSAYPLIATKRYERQGYTLGLYTFRFTSPREAGFGSSR